MLPLCVLAVIFLSVVHVAFALAVFKRNNGVADVFWGLYFLVLTGGAFAFFAAPDLRQGILLSLVAIWGLRLSWHIGRRNWGKPEDPRYAAWRKDWGKWAGLRSYFQVFLLQGLLAVVIVSPVLWVMQAPSVPFGLLDGLGLGVWLLGFLFESVGDAQLAAFVRTKKPGEIMTHGLWAYTRHPNYFGEVTQWWGLFIIALSVPGGLCFLGGPVTITALILFVSGVPLLEQRYAGNAAFEAYKKCTSLFVPWFPKKTRGR